MADLYHILAQLCNQHQITPYRMCKDTGIQPSVMTDLKKGRRQTVKQKQRRGLQITLALQWIICLERKPVLSKMTATLYKKN